MPRTSKTPEIIRGTARDLQHKAEGVLSGTKDKMEFGTLFRRLFDNLKSGQGKEALSSVTAIIVAVFAGRLATLKKSVEESKDVKTNVKKRAKRKVKKEVVEGDETGEGKDEQETPEAEALAEIPDKGIRVTKIAEKMVHEGVTAKHCWHWIDKVYEAAHVRRKVLFSSFNKYEGKDCGEHHASQEWLDQVTPGDHIFINNKNRFDANGNHSVIFLDWQDKGRKTVKVAGYPGNGRPPVIYQVDLNKQPVTYISRPT